MPGAGEPERPAHQRLRVVRLLRLDELEAHFPLLAKKAAAFRRKSRSIVTVFSSRRSRVFSARSSLVSGPCGSFLSSIFALFTQARTLVSVSPSSRDTAPTLLPLVRISFITSALYSFVNDLLALAMDSILHHIGGVREIGAGSCGRSKGESCSIGAPGRLREWATQTKRGELRLLCDRLDWRKDCRRRRQEGQGSVVEATLSSSDTSMAGEPERHRAR